MLRSGPLDPGLVACTLCGTKPVGYLAAAESRPDDRFVLADPLLCARCHELVSGPGSPASDAELAARLVEEFARWERPVVVERLRDRIIDIEVLAPAGPEIARLTGQGFEPLELHTGITDRLGPLWPEADRVAMADPRPHAETDAPVWFVRSPWPTIALAEIFGFMWRWVERDPRPDDPAAWSARVTEVLGWDETRALAWAGLCAEE